MGVTVKVLYSKTNDFLVVHIFWVLIRECVWRDSHPPQRGNSLVATALGLAGKVSLF
jgi:hypothetical protein